MNKLSKTEKKKRAKNFIVHGLEELGEENKEISVNDVEIKGLI